MTYDEVLTILKSGVHADHVALRHASLPMEVWARVLKADEDIRWAMILNKHIPAEALWQFVKDPSERVRGFLARKGACSAEILEALSRDPSENVRATLCYHRKLPRSLLDRLANDPSLWVASMAREVLQRY